MPWLIVTESDNIFQLQNLEELFEIFNFDTNIDCESSKVRLFDCFQGCKERIQAARAQKLVSDGSVVVAIESFINELVPGT